MVASKCSGNVRSLTLQSLSSLHPAIKISDSSSLWQWPSKKQFLDLDNSFPKNSRQTNSSDTENTFTCEDRNTLYMRWYAVINDYAKRNLTVETDKLPALSGVAQKFQAKLQDDYVTGLFASDLHRGLLWTPGGNLENNS
jgi:hypothetical protein